MPQLDIFIFFSQYFIFLFFFIFFYLFVVKFLIKEIDYREQMGKYKMVYILTLAATMRMIFDKTNEKTKDFSVLAIQFRKNLNKNFLFELLLQINLYKKFSTIWFNINKLEKNTLNFINYIFK